MVFNSLSTFFITWSMTGMRISTPFFITWNNGWGQIYSILGSNDLAPDKEWVEIRTDSWVDGLGSDGSGGIPSARDTEGLLANTEFVPFSSGYQYFKLRIKQR